MNWALMRGHSFHVIWTRCQDGSPPVHSWKKKPRLPKGVDRHTSRPCETASIGRTLRYRSSGTRAASSITSKRTPENDRTVASLPGSDTIRDWFFNSS